MSGHDPLCQTRTGTYPSWCDCPRVQAIRADQDERIAGAYWVAVSRSAWLTDLRAKVEALRRPPAMVVPIADVLALLSDEATP